MTKLATSKTKRQGKHRKSPETAKSSTIAPQAPAEAKANAKKSADPSLPVAKTKREEKQLARDRELVRRCVAGDIAGWEEMYQECNPKLILNIRGLIRPYGHNANLADEIASRVWCSLIGANGTLLDRYDSHRGCKLSTFFAALARYELLKYWRSEKRRREREQAVVRRRVRHRFEKSESFHIAWGEFVDTLTPRERDFLEQVLIAPENGEELPASIVAGLTTIVENSAAKSEQLATNGEHKIAAEKHVANGEHREANGKQNGAANGKETANGHCNANDVSHAADAELTSDSIGGLSQANSWQLRSRVLSKLKRYSGTEKA